ncbi:MAG: hypothetical protein ABW061_05175 [Polyangiaceae bacterium]
MAPRSTLSFLLALGVLCGAPLAHAEPLGSHQPHIQASLGVRASKVSDAGFDPFADSDELLQVSLGVGGTVLRFQRLSLAAVGFWDYGERSSTARGAQTSLDVHRLSVGPELRYHVLTPLYVFAHVLPAFAHSKASLDDGLTVAPRSAAHWAYGADFALGAAFEAYSARNAGPVQPRLWAIAEGGYGYLGSTKLRLQPDASQGAPERTAPVDLGSVSLAGPYLRISAAVSF